MPDGETHETAANRLPAAPIARRLWPAAPALGCGVLMFAIAFIGAGRPVLSWDEIATADAASRTPAQLWDLIQHVDGVFFAYYALEHFWTMVAGTTELALRLPSMVAMAVAVALVAELGRELFGRAAGAVAGLFLCAIPNCTRYGDEARPYAFACLFVVASLLLIHRAASRPRWFAYGVAVIGLGLAHVVALTSLAAHAVVLARRRDRRLLVPWLVTVGAALALLAPIMWMGLHERDAQLSWVPAFTVHRLWKLPGGLVGSVPGAWLLIGLATLGLARWMSPGRVLETLTLAVAPVGVLALVSVLVAPYWVVRYLLFVLVPLALLAAVGLLGPRGGDAAGTGARRWRVVAFRAGVGLLVLAVAVWPAQRAVRGATAKHGSDYRTAAQLVHRYQQPGDGIVYPPRSRTMRTGLLYYLRDDVGGPRDLLLRRSAAQDGTLRAEEVPDEAAHVSGTPRIWIFAYGRHPDPTTVRPALAPMLRGSYRLAHLWYPHHATLALLLLRGHATPARSVR